MRIRERIRPADSARVTEAAAALLAGSHQNARIPVPSALKTFAGTFERPCKLAQLLEGLAEEFSAMQE